MRRILFLVIIVITFILSCSKDVDLTVVDTGLPPCPSDSPEPDMISYTDSADIYLVSPTGPYSPCPATIPLPIDTLFSDSIDIDADGTYDLKFSDKHFTSGYSASNPCPTFRSQLTVEGRNSNIKIVTSDLFYPTVTGFYLNDPISSSYDYSSFVFIKGGPMGGPYAVTSPGEYYIGIQITKDYCDTFYGWVRIENTGINGVIIKDYAINLTDGNTILAGQTL